MLGTSLFKFPFPFQLIFLNSNSLYSAVSQPFGVKSQEIEKTETLIYQRFCHSPFYSFLDKNSFGTSPSKLSISLNCNINHLF